MLVTREADYALRSVLELARSGKISVAEVARRQGISATFLGKIVRSLARAGILSTRRGVGGGVSLLRPVESITLLQVIEAVEGPLCVNACQTKPAQCLWIESCPAYPVFCRVQQSVEQLLSMTVADLLGEADRAPPVRLPDVEARTPLGALHAEVSRTGPGGGAP